MKNLVVLSGAGISAESGIKTFRDSDGLWEGNDVMQIASPIGWADNPELVLDFYNKRRAQLFDVSPNAAHQMIAELQSHYHVRIITQNVDDLHERCGSDHVMHLHGELKSVRSDQDQSMTYYWEDDVHIGDIADDGAQLRPNIVWFGEDVPLIENALWQIASADILLIIGTSLQVYPAASLYQYAPEHATVYYIDPNASQHNLPQFIHCISHTATTGMELLLPSLIADS